MKTLIVALGTALLITLATNEAGASDEPATVLVAVSYTHLTLPTILRV